MNKAYKAVLKGAPWKLSVIIPYDGEPSIPEWQEQIDAINIGITGLNLLQNQSREDVWLNTQQVQYDYNSGENENLINRYFNENDQLLESVEWFWDNGEWFLGSRLAYYYHEDGTLDYYTFGFRLDENGFFIEDYHYMHFYNADGSLSHMDIFYHGNGNPELIYGYTYVFSEDDEGIVTDILVLRYGWGASEGELNGAPIMMETYNYDNNDDFFKSNFTHVIYNFPAFIVNWHDG